MTDKRLLSEETDKQQSSSQAERRTRHFFRQETGEGSRSSTNHTDQGLLNQLAREAHDLYNNQERLLHGVRSFPSRIVSDAQLWAAEKSQELGDSFDQLRTALSTVEAYKNLDQQSQEDMTQLTKAQRAYRKIETLVSEIMADNPSFYGSQPNNRSRFGKLVDYLNSLQNFQSGDTNPMGEGTFKLNLEHIHKTSDKEQKDNNMARKTNEEIQVKEAISQMSRTDLQRLKHGMKHIPPGIVSDAQLWAAEKSQEPGDSFDQLRTALSIVKEHNNSDPPHANGLLAYRKTEILASDIMADTPSLYESQPNNRSRFGKLVDYLNSLQNFQSGDTEDSAMEVD